MPKGVISGVKMPLSDRVDRLSGTSNARPDQPEEEASSSPVGKLFAVLEQVSQSGSVRVTSLSEQLNMPKTTIHRIISQLERLGYIQREPGGRRFSASPRLVDLASDLLGASVRLAPRHQVLLDLSNEIGETCSLGVRVGYEIVYADAVTVISPLSIHFQPGRRAPLHCTSVGKLFLAQLVPKEFREYLATSYRVKFTEFTVIEAEALAGIVNKVAEENFAVSMDEFVLGVSGAAVPVRNRNGRMLAGLTVSIPSARLDPSGVASVRAPLERAAARMAETFME